MKNIKNIREVSAILIGIILTYFWQLFIVIICYLIDRDFVDTIMFIPSLKIQIMLTPIISWMVMGIINVAWINKWNIVTISFLKFLVPFIFMITFVAIENPLLFTNIKTWIIIIFLSNIIKKIVLS